MYSSDLYIAHIITGQICPAVPEMNVLILFRGAVVLPSYGMTECMPISSPPLTYQLDRAGTSGKGVGPNLAIVSPSGEELRRGKIGCIAVQGPPNFKRYENVPVSLLDSAALKLLKTACGLNLCQLLAPDCIQT